MSAFSEAFENARGAAANGLRVFPTHTVADGRCSCGRECNSPGKHPRTANGLKDASADERQLLQWNDRWADANWAVACGSNVSVIDIDTKAGADPTEIISDYELGGRPTVWTGAALAGELEGVRGAHVYSANGVRTGPTGAAGVEIRGPGAYVLLPGSRHVSGVAYEWANGARPWTTELQPVPAALVPRRQVTRNAPNVSTGERVGHGERHAHLRDFAVRLVRAGITDERLLAAHLWTQFHEACDPHPEPEAGSIEKLAAWAASSEIADRERDRAQDRESGSTRPGCSSRPA